MAVIVDTTLIASVQKWKTFPMVTGRLFTPFFLSSFFFFISMDQKYSTILRNVLIRYFCSHFRYCHECMNKATGERNCLVCGKRMGKNLVLCELCPRAYHTDCHNPVMPKVRGEGMKKWIFVIWGAWELAKFLLFRFSLSFIRYIDASREMVLLKLSQQTTKET